MVFGNCGVLSSSSMIDGKGYVEMTSIDAETSQDIATSIIQKGGRYLEAQVSFHYILYSLMIFIQLRCHEFMSKKFMTSREITNIISFKFRAKKSQFLSIPKKMFNEFIVNNSLSVAFQIIHSLELIICSLDTNS